MKNLAFFVGLFLVTTVRCQTPTCDEFGADFSCVDKSTCTGDLGNWIPQPINGKRPSGATCTNSEEKCCHKNDLQVDNAPAKCHEACATCHCQAKSLCTDCIVTGACLNPDDVCCPKEGEECPVPEAEPSLGAGATAGIVIGVLIAIAILAVVAYFVWRRQSEFASVPA